jgi:hypothetical protein
MIRHNKETPSHLSRGAHNGDLVRLGAQELFGTLASGVGKVKGLSRNVVVSVGHQR